MGLWTSKPAYGAPIDRSPSFASALIRFWALREGSGTVAHDEAQGNNAFVFSGRSNWTTSRYGSVVAFGGTGGGLLSSGPTINPASGDFTAACWFVPNAVATNQTLIQQEDGSGTGRTWLQITNTAKIASFLGNTSTNGGTVAAGAWQCGAVQLQGATLSVWINGASAASATITIESNDNAQLRLSIGKGGTGNAFTGSVSHVLVWQRALSAAEHVYLASGVMSAFDAMFPPDDSPLDLFPAPAAASAPAAALLPAM